MTTLDALIQEILNSPGISLVSPQAPRPAVWSQGTEPDPQWGWYDSRHDQLPGLEVTEHQISPTLCQAVFQNRFRRHG
jgi:hypothetical protein